MVVQSCGGGREEILIPELQMKCSIVIEVQTCYLRKLFLVVSHTKFPHGGLTERTKLGFKQLCWQLIASVGFIFNIKMSGLLFKVCVTDAI